MINRAEANKYAKTRTNMANDGSPNNKDNRNNLVGMLFFYKKIQFLSINVYNFRVFGS